MKNVLIVLLPSIYLRFAFAQDDASSDGACIGKCSEELRTKSEAILPSSIGNTELTASEAARFQSKSCELYGEMKTCMLLCDGGNVAWEAIRVDGSAGEQFLGMCGLTGGVGDSSSADFQDMICAQNCQLNSSQEFSKIVGKGLDSGPKEPASDSSVDIAIALERNRQLCAAEDEMKNCILGCKGGQQIWETQFTSFVSYCSTGPDGIQSQACPVTCQQQQSDQLAQLVPQNWDALSPSDQDEAAKKSCPIFEEMKSCVLKCDGGEEAWKDMLKQTELSGGGDGGNVVEICGLGDGSGDASTNLASIADSPFSGTSLFDLLCTTACQEASDGKMKSALSGPDPVTPDDISSRSKQLCDALNEYKDCVLSCGQTGQRLWQEVFVNDFTSDNSIKPFFKTCFPDYYPAEPLENYQCYAGTCTRCKEMTSEQCNPHFLTFPTLSACENSECGSMEGGNNCQMNGSALGEDETNLNCNPDIAPAECPASYACLPLEMFGAHFCCPDTPEQAQIICMQKCSSFINSQQSKVMSLITQPEEFHEAACSLYNTEKDCILKCPSGQSGLDSYQQKQLSNDDIYQNLMETCGNTSVGITSDGSVDESTSAFSGASFFELLCATTCQEASDGRIKSAMSGPHPVTPDEISSRTKQLCDVLNEYKDCVLTCGQTGQRLWQEVFVNSSTSDKAIAPFVRTCFPDYSPEEPLENYQCYVGTCTKCKDMPSEQCNLDFLTYPTLSACENSKCGSIEGGNNCQMNGSALGESETNLNCNPDISPAECPASYACLPLEVFGAHFCCPDTPEQAQIICMQKCSSSVNSQQSKVTSLITQPEAFHEAACSLYNTEKDCILKCPSGQTGLIEHQQKQLSNDGEFYQNLMETCGNTSVGITSDGSLGGNTSDDANLSDTVCAFVCQEGLQDEVANALSGPDPELIADITGRTKQLCDIMNDLKTCLLTCGPFGQKIWNEAITNTGTQTDANVKLFARTCFPDTVPVTEELLEDYQCFAGTCTKCKDMPQQQCNPAFNSYSSKSDCESTLCGKKDEGVSNYDNCKLDGSTLGVSAINLNCNPNIAAAGCPPSQACLPVEVFGSYYCCPDTQEQRQIFCMGKCESKMMGRAAKLTDLIAQPDVFQNEACSLFNDTKDCILDCPMGTEGWAEYDQKELATDEGFYKNLRETCGYSDSIPDESLKSEAATSETSPEVADYCLRVLNERNGDTAFCRYQNFTETCKNVCPQ